MRPQQQNRRMRGRNNNNNSNNNNNNNNHNHNRKGPNPLTRSYESNGPDVKIRGSAQQIAEKYTTLARDATSSGDRVMAENYLQHAEHYNRIIAAAQAAMPQPVRDQRSDFDEDMDDEGDGFENGQGQREQGSDQQPRNQAQDGQSDDGDSDDNGNRNDGNRNDGQRNDGQRADGNQQPRNERREQRGDAQGQREPREGREPRERRPFRERNRNASQDGSGPQPVIEGVPAEVAYGEPQTIQTRANEAAPVIQAHAVNGEANGHAAGADVNGHANGAPAEEAPAAVVAEEAAPKVRRPRRPRTPKADVAESAAEAGGEVEPAS